MILRALFPHTRETVRALVLVLALTVLGTAAGYAGSHWGGGGSGWGSRMVFDGVLLGLGSNVAWVDLEIKGFVRAICENKGGTQAAGRNYIQVGVTALGGPFPTDSNGRADVHFEADEPTLPDLVDPSPSPKEAGCPNGNWKVVDILPNSEDWRTVTAFARAGDGPTLDTLYLTCTTSFRADGTTFGTCQE